MKLQPGDTVFNRDSRPATIRSIAPDTGELELESRYDMGKTDLRHGYINGLSLEERKTYNTLLDGVKQGKDTEERVLKLREVIDTLKLEPKNHKLINYLESQMNHLMRTENYQPRTYSISSSSTE